MYLKYVVDNETGQGPQPNEKLDGVARLNTTTALSQKIKNSHLFYVYWT